ncbi:MAG: serine hydrolase [Gemmatimonadales bacterium]|nr:serine hydrolase [Gemmatimonadales bacterium]
MPNTVIRCFTAATILTVACGGRAAPDVEPDPELQRGLERLAGEVRGIVGIYVRHLRTGRSAAIRAEEAFPTASMVKVPILIGTFDAIARGRLSFDQPLVYTDSLLYPGEDLIGALADSATIPLSKAALLMITTSDNTASLWLQGLVGGGAINDWLAAHGFDSTRVNSRVPGREDARSRHGWGQTTPREMAELLVLIREGRAVSPAASQEMYRHLTRIYWTGEALSRIPPWVQAASKQGAVDRSKSEVVLVNAPSGDYVFSVITREQEDERWEDENEGYVLIRRVSELLWRTFEPELPWTPAPGVDAFKPREED